MTDSWYLTSWKLIWLNLFVHDAINSIWLLLRAFKQTPENYLQNAAWLRWVADTRAVICFFLQEFEHKRARCPTPPRVHSTVDVLSHSVCSCWDGRIGCCINIRICLRHWHLDSNDTAPHPKPYSTDSLDCSLSLCISLHTAGRDGSLTERDIVEVHLILNCDVIFLTLEKSLLSYV